MVSFAPPFRQRYFSLTACWQYRRSSRAELVWVSTLVSLLGGSTTYSLSCKVILLDMVLNALHASHTSYCVSFFPIYVIYRTQRAEHNSRLRHQSACLHECVPRHSKCLSSQRDIEKLSRLVCSWVLNDIWDLLPQPTQCIEKLLLWCETYQKLVLFSTALCRWTRCPEASQILLSTCVLPTISSFLATTFTRGWFSFSTYRHQGM